MCGVWSDDLHQGICFKRYPSVTSLGKTKRFKSKTYCHFSLLYVTHHSHAHNSRRNNLRMFHQLVFFMFWMSQFLEFSLNSIFDNPFLEKIMFRCLFSLSRTISSSKRAIDENRVVEAIYIIYTSNIE